ncbi:MAG: hypothetical protein U0802_05365 [Candidatus Binatia bacterium]
MAAGGLLLLIAIVVGAHAAPARGGDAPLLPDGTACSGASQCASTFCADGICCNRACDHAFETCDAPPAPGTCMAVAPAPPKSRRGLYTGIALLTLLGAALLWQRRRGIAGSSA